MSKLTAGVCRRLRAREVSKRPQHRFVHREAVGPNVSTLRDVQRLLETFHGAGLRYVDTPSALGEKPAWAALVRGRISVLHRSIRMFQLEKDVLLEKLGNVCSDLDGLSSVRPKRSRWAVGVLNSTASV